MNSPVLINLKKDNLRKQGYESFTEWFLTPGNVYIGHNQHKYLRIPTRHIQDVSDFANPFCPKYFGASESKRRYKEHILKSDNLRNKLKNLTNCQIDCYCDDDTCHAATLLECYHEVVPDECIDNSEF